MRSPDTIARVAVFSSLSFLGPSRGNSLCTSWAAPSMRPSVKPEHFEGAAHRVLGAAPRRPPSAAGVQKQNARCLALLAEAAREATAEQDSTGIYAVSSDEEAHRRVKLYS